MVFVFLLVHFEKNHFEQTHTKPNKYLWICNLGTWRKCWLSVNKYAERSSRNKQIWSSWQAISRLGFGALLMPKERLADGRTAVDTLFRSIVMFLLHFFFSQSPSYFRILFFFYSFLFAFFSIFLPYVSFDVLNLSCTSLVIYFPLQFTKETYSVISIVTQSWLTCVGFKLLSYLFIYLAFYNPVISRLLLYKHYHLRLEYNARNVKRISLEIKWQCIFLVFKRFPKYGDLVRQCSS